MQVIHSENDTVEQLEPATIPVALRTVEDALRAWDAANPQYVRLLGDERLASACLNRRLRPSPGSFRRSGQRQETASLSNTGSVATQHPMRRDLRLVTGGSLCSNRDDPRYAAESKGGRLDVLP